jgi:hypothetical protein
MCIMKNVGRCKIICANFDNFVDFVKGRRLFVDMPNLTSLNMPP